MASRKNKLKITPVGWLLIGVLIVLAGVLLAVLLNRGKDYSYNGFDIQKTKCQGTDLTCWNVQMDVRKVPYTVQFYNHPKDVADVAISPDAMRAVIAMQRVQNHTVYIAVPKNSPGETGVAGVALARVLGQRYGIMNLNVKGATYGTEPGEVTCSNAGPHTLVVSLEQQPIDAVLLQSPNCIVIGATNVSRIVPVTEAFSYHILGVIPTYAGNGTLLR